MLAEIELPRVSTARLKTETPVSVKELVTIGIGPSSSHTVGPMRAAHCFAEMLGPERRPQVTKVVIELFGSLALTGNGHTTDTAVILSLLGWQPEIVDPDRVPEFIGYVRKSSTLMPAGHHPVPFTEKEHLLLRKREFLSAHPNAVRFSAFFENAPAFVQQYYSIGGGAIIPDGEEQPDARPGSNIRQPYPFSSAAELLACRKLDRKLPIAQSKHPGRPRHKATGVGGSGGALALEGCSGHELRTLVITHSRDELLLSCCQK
ncbi:MAG: hypothetical protein JOY71_29455 [Acetobacteraceae bacterium]|nr:hypothetical protein [Acetobacteraceae bacterium]